MPCGWNNARGSLQERLQPPPPRPRPPPPPAHDAKDQTAKNPAPPPGSTTSQQQEGATGNAHEILPTPTPTTLAGLHGLAADCGFSLSLNRHGVTPLHAHDIGEPALYLDAVAAGERKQKLGEQLYPLIAAKQPGEACKITSMILEMLVDDRPATDDELLALLQDPASLNEKIATATGVLAEHRRQQNPPPAARDVKDQTDKDPAPPPVAAQGHAPKPAQVLLPAPHDVNDKSTVDPVPPPAAPQECAPQPAQAPLPPPLDLDDKTAEDSESRSTTWLTVCAGAVIMLALALALNIQLPAFYSSANESKTAASIVTDINEFSSSANVTYVDVNAQQCFACTGAIKGSPFIVRIEDAELQACPHC